jgi:predicted Zn-dependent protease
VWAAASPALWQALESELKRSLDGLRYEQFGPPYFLGYQVVETDRLDLRASFGALYRADAERTRHLFVEARVGDPAFDSSSASSDTGRHDDVSSTLSLEDDLDALRRQVWTATDRRYKTAVSRYLTKKARAVQQLDLDRPDDFSREEAHVDAVLPPAFPPFPRERWEAIVRAASARFREAPDLLGSSVELSVRRVTRYYLNSEGTRVAERREHGSLRLFGWLLAEDGMFLENAENLSFIGEEEFPSEEEIRRHIDKLITEIRGLRKAPVLDPYVGPALLDPDAAGVLFHEAVGHRLEGERQRNEREGRTFKNKVGSPITAAFLSIYDDPTLPAHDGRLLFGHYQWDDEGQPSRRATLVEGGVLRGFLLSRTPLKEFPRSNGHGRSDGRRDPMARMATLLVEAKETLTPEALKARLLEEVRRQGKPYGLIIRKVRGGETHTSTYDFQAFKGTPVLIERVYADGRTELVRGAEFVGTPLSSINKVLAAGDDPKTFNGFCGAESGVIPVSSIAPSILIGEMELQRKPARSLKPPILPPPPIEKIGER